MKRSKLETVLLSYHYSISCNQLNPRPQWSKPISAVINTEMCTSKPKFSFEIQCYEEIHYIASTGQQVVVKG